MASPKRKLILLILVQALVPFLSGKEDAADSGISPTRAIQQLLLEAETLKQSGDYDRGIALSLDALDRSLLLKDPSLTAQAHYQTAVFHNFKGEFDQARAHLELGLDLARAQKDQYLAADLLVAQGIVEWKLGNLNLASHHLGQALALREELNDWTGLANVANNLGIIQYSLRNYNLAIEYYEKGLGWLDTQDNDRLRSSLLSNLAESLIPVGDFQRADTYLQEALEIETRRQDPHSMAYVYLNLAKLRSIQNRPGESIVNFRLALKLQVDAGETWAAALTRIELAREHLKQEDSRAALEVLEPGFDAAKRLNAHSLLRDYADLYTRIYGLQNENGLKVYYQDLRDWFDHRVQQPIDSNTNNLLRPSDEGNTYYSVQSREMNLVWLRLAILSMLALMIIILAMENLRLRKSRTGGTP